MSRLYIGNTRMKLMKFCLKRDRHGWFPGQRVYHPLDWRRTNRSIWLILWDILNGSPETVTRRVQLAKAGG